MKTKKEKITIENVKVLGSYGKMIPFSESYPHTLRKLSKDVKKQDCTAISMAALLLSQIITPNAVIIPIPQSNGVAEYTLSIANIIKVIRQDCEVIDILSGTPRKKLYDIKKRKSNLKGTHVGLKVKETADCKELLQSNSNVFLLDNVVNTGFTFNRARKALKKYAKVNPALLAISATAQWIA